MSAETPAPAPAPAAQANWSDVHPKVSATVLAGAVASLVIGVLKHYKIDLADQEPNIMIIVGALAGYLMPASN